MTGTTIRNWQAVQHEVLERINARVWKPGELIPTEVDLAEEFGCARATVNRALQNLAESGLLDRKRKAGTRVAIHPVRKATLDIPVIRNEITNKGSVYRYSLIGAVREQPPADMIARMQLNNEAKLLHVHCLHMANNDPYVFENRWINPEVVPEALTVDFSAHSPNEWLVENVPFSAGDITFSALSAGKREVDILGCKLGDGLFVIDRSTWKETGSITSVRLTFAPGYKMHTDI